MKKLYHITAIVLFLAVLFGIPVCFLMQEDMEFSESENRYLAAKPAISVENILSGKFMRDTEQYINDQFPKKDFWISCKSDFMQLLGSKEIGGVYLAKDDYLIEKWLTEEFDEELLTKNTETLTSFAQQHPEQKISLMLVPTAGMILSDKLPKDAPMFNQKIVYDIVNTNLNGISTIDLSSLFASHNTKSLYYKTDHHWTTYGAFLAYSAWCEMNGQSVNQNEYEIEIVTEEFQGTLQSKVLGTHCAFDKIDLYKQKNGTPYRVEYNFGKTHSDTVYALERLSQKDKYQVFLGGNHPEITIKTSQRNGKHLLVIKDSFANAFIPFLLNDYETIHIIDPRYYHGNIDEYILDNNINECLFLYNTKNFCEDKNIGNLFN